MTKLIQLGILILPWVFLPKAFMPAPYDQFRTAQEVCFNLICLGIIFFSFKDGLKYLYRNKYLAVLVSWIFITFWFNFYYPYAMKGVINISLIVPMVHTLLVVWTSFIALSYLDSDNFIEIAKALCLSATIVAVFALLQISGLDPIGKAGMYKHDQINHCTAFFGHFNLVGNYLAIIAPLFLFFKEKKYLIGFVIVCACCILSKSDMSLIALVIGIFITLCLKFRFNKKILLGIFLIFFLLGSGFVIKNYDSIKNGSIMTGRQVIWKQAYEKGIKQNPLFGQGIGCFKTLPVWDGPTKCLEAHNDWIERTVDWGLLGTFLMILIVINALRNFNYKKGNDLGFSYMGAFIAFLFVMIGSFPMEIAPLGFAGLIVWWSVEKL